MLRTNQKFYDLYKIGDYEKSTPVGAAKTWIRSEAEQSVLVMLVMEGFSDNEIDALMENCALGKWQERNDSYRT